MLLTRMTRRRLAHLFECAKGVPKESLRLILAILVILLAAVVPTLAAAPPDPKASDSAYQLGAGGRSAEDQRVRVSGHGGGCACRRGRQHHVRVRGAVGRGWALGPRCRD